MTEYSDDIFPAESAGGTNYSVGQDTSLWRDEELVNLTTSDADDVVTHQCFENGSLMVPIYIGNGNQTLTEAAQVRKERRSQAGIYKVVIIETSASSSRHCVTFI